MRTDYQSCLDGHICTDFNIVANSDDDHTVRTIYFNHVVTGNETYVKVLPYLENMAIHVDPSNGAYFISLLAEAGFYISPHPEALHRFLHILIFPDDVVNSFGEYLKVTNKGIPDDVKIITSRMKFNKELENVEH